MNVSRLATELGCSGLRAVVSVFGAAIDKAFPATVAERAHLANMAFAASHAWEAVQVIPHAPNPLISPAAESTPPRVLPPTAAGPNFDEVQAVVVEHMRGHYRQLERPGTQGFRCRCGLRNLTASQHFNHAAEILTSEIVHTFEVSSR